MSENSIIIFDVQQQFHGNIKKCLKEIEDYLGDEADEKGLRIVNIRLIYDEKDNNIVNNLEVKFKRAEDPNGQIHSENLLEPIEETIKRLYADTKQKEIDSKKTLDERREALKEYTENSETIEINGESVHKPELQVKNPKEKNQKKKKDDDVIRLYSFDFERARVVVGNRSININPQVGEAVREELRREDWSNIVEKGYFDFTEHKMLLNNLIIGLQKAVKVLDEPGLFFHSENDPPE